MSEEIRFAQKHFRDALGKINPHTESGLYSLAQGLNCLAQAIEHLETEAESIRRAVQPSKQ